MIISKSRNKKTKSERETKIERAGATLQFKGMPYAAADYLSSTLSLGDSNALRENYY